MRSLSQFIVSFLTVCLFASVSHAYFVECSEVNIQKIKNGDTDYLQFLNKKVIEIMSDTKKNVAQLDIIAIKYGLKAYFGFDKSLRDALSDASFETSQMSKVDSDLFYKNWMWI